MKLVPEFIEEVRSQRIFEFERTGDPKRSMGIGIEAQIRNFIKNETPYDIKGPWRHRNKEPLWVCSKYNKPLFVRHLLDAGEDVHANHDAALRWACGMGHTEVVKLLLDAGAYPPAEGAGRDYECYAWATREGHHEVIKLLNDSKRGAKFSEPVDRARQVPREEPLEEPREEPEKPEENKWI